MQRLVVAIVLLFALLTHATPSAAQGKGGVNGGATTQATNGGCEQFSCFAWLDPFGQGFACLASQSGLHFGICRATAYSCEYTPCSVVLRTRFDGTPIREERSCGSSTRVLVQTSMAAQVLVGTT